MPIAIPYEQAVYGSFPFWDRGYAVLAHSPGCRAEWLAELKGVCQRYGERPSSALDAAGLFALRLSSGPWVVIGPRPQGSDDRGRPGALAFHAIFLNARAYRRAECNPFALAHLLRGQWTAETRSLPVGLGSISGPTAAAETPDEDAAAVASLLARGRGVAIESDGPIDALARNVWARLPARLRQRASVATWTFGNGNRFDLFAAPRLAGVELDARYVVASTRSALGLGSLAEQLGRLSSPVSARARPGPRELAAWALSTFVRRAPRA
jgi:hypothetical protein